MKFKLLSLIFIAGLSLVGCGSVGTSETRSVGANSESGIVSGDGTYVGDDNSNGGGNPIAAIAATTKEATNFGNDNQQSSSYNQGDTDSISTEILEKMSEENIQGAITDLQSEISNLQTQLSSNDDSDFTSNKNKIVKKLETIKRYQEQLKAKYSSN